MLVGLRRRRNHITLTFDDGPEQSFRPVLIDLLTASAAPQHFFIQSAVKQNGRWPDLVQRVLAEGRELGNHTWSPPQPRRCSPPSRDPARESTAGRPPRAHVSRATPPRWRRPAPGHGHRLGRAPRPPGPGPGRRRCGASTGAAAADGDAAGVARHLRRPGAPTRAPSSASTTAHRRGAQPPRTADWPATLVRSSGPPRHRRPPRLVAGRRPGHGASACVTLAQGLVALALHVIKYLGLEAPARPGAGELSAARSARARPRPVHRHDAGRPGVQAARARSSPPSTSPATPTSSPAATSRPTPPPSTRRRSPMRWPTSTRCRASPATSPRRSACGPATSSPRTARASTPSATRSRALRRHAARPDPAHQPDGGGRPRRLHDRRADGVPEGVGAARAQAA